MTWVRAGTFPVQRVLYAPLEQYHMQRKEHRGMSPVFFFFFSTVLV